MQRLYQLYILGGRQWTIKKRLNSKTQEDVFTNLHLCMWNNASQRLPFSKFSTLNQQYILRVKYKSIVDMIQSTATDSVFSTSYFEGLFSSCLTHEASRTQMKRSIPEFDWRMVALLSQSLHMSLHCHTRYWHRSDCVLKVRGDKCCIISTVCINVWAVYNYNSSNCI